MPDKLDGVGVIKVVALDMAHEQHNDSRLCSFLFTWLGSRSFSALLSVLAHSADIGKRKIKRERDFYSIKTTGT